MPLVSEPQVPPGNPCPADPGTTRVSDAIPGRLGLLEAAAAFPSRSFSGDCNLCPGVPAPGHWRGWGAGGGTVAGRGPDSDVCTETYMGWGNCYCPPPPPTPRTLFLVNEEERAALIMPLPTLLPSSTGLRWEGL